MIKLDQALTIKKNKMELIKITLHFFHQAQNTREMQITLQIIHQDQIHIIINRIQFFKTM